MVIAQKSFVHNFSFILNDPFRWRTQATLSSTEHLSGASNVMYSIESQYKQVHSIRKINRFNYID